MVVRGAARVGGIPAEELYEWFYPVWRWPTWARRLWFNGFGPGMGPQRFTLWKFFWYNGVHPQRASRWVLRGYWGGNMRDAMRETENWERYARSEDLTSRYLLHGNLMDMQLGYVVNLTTGQKAMAFH